ncbi:recombination protein O N-terminal domain-containing protein [Acanthopleuribacter pedis]|nr:recombination protein O N-terminal domain-containing protein [Acanthopleuribacter pedis]
MQQKCQGFVVHHTRLSASRYIVHVFTEEEGQRALILRTSKKVTMVYLTPLCRVACELSGKQHQNLHQIREIRLLDHNFDVAGNYLGLSLMHHWGWLIHQSQPEGQEDARVTRLLIHLMDFLARRQKAGKLLPGMMPHLNAYLETWLLVFAGVFSRDPQSLQWLLQDLAENHGIRPAPWLPGDTDYTTQLFELKIEPFLDYALQWGALTRLHRALGDIWEHFLAKPIKTRANLVHQFNERRLL